MAIYELHADEIVELPETTFGSEGVKERADLQRLLRTRIDVVSPDTFVIGEEFGQWQDSKRRVDLLALDKSANLVVIELKRTEDGGHMELQAIRYAAMVSTLTFEQVVAARAEFQTRHGIEGDAAQAILSFLEWDDADEDQFAQDVRLVLVSADFSKELTTAVMWLNTHDLDIRCVRLKPYSLQGRVLLDVQQVIPLPEVADYQVQVKEKVQKGRKARKANMDFTRYDISVGGRVYRAQWKRRAILIAVQALIKSGVPAARITDLLNWRPGAVWWEVDGKCDMEQFLVKAAQSAKTRGKTFNERRWFIRDDELFHIGDATLAFTNQWGVHWPRAMKVLTEAFPEQQITFTPSKTGDSAEVEP